MKQLNEEIKAKLAIGELEFETIIRGPPTHICANRCPAYRLEPCGTCDYRPVKEVITERIPLLTAVKLGMISLDNATELILTPMRGGQWQL